MIIKVFSFIAALLFMCGCSDRVAETGGNRTNGKPDLQKTAEKNDSQKAVILNKFDEIQKELNSLNAYIRPLMLDLNAAMLEQLKSETRSDAKIKSLQESHDLLKAICGRAELKQKEMEARQKEVDKMQDRQIADIKKTMDDELQRNAVLAKQLASEMAEIEKRLRPAINNKAN